MTNNEYVSLQVKCAGPNCSSVRTPRNHWLAIMHANPNMISVKPLRDTHLRMKHIKPVCGETCAIRVVSAWLSTMSARQTEAQ